MTFQDSDSTLVHPGPAIAAIGDMTAVTAEPYTMPIIGTNEPLLLGTAADDRLYAGKGTEVIDGGAGSDTYVTNNSFSRFRVAYDAATDSYTITKTGSGPSDSYTLRNIERIEFADLTLTPAEAAAMAHPQAGADGVQQGSDLGYEQYGGNADDQFQGNGGNDVLYGGKGSDTAIFRGQRADYTIGYDPVTGRYVVTDSVSGRDGADEVHGIELLRFADGAIELGGVDQMRPAGDPAAAWQTAPHVRELPPPEPMPVYDWTDDYIGTWPVWNDTVAIELIGITFETDMPVVPML